MEIKSNMIYAGRTVSWKDGKGRDYGTLVDFYALGTEGIYALILNLDDKFIYMEAGEITLEAEEGE